MLKAKNRIKSARTRFVSNREAYRFCIETAIKAEQKRKERRVRFQLWWHDGTQERTIRLGHFGTVAEMFALVEEHLGAPVDAVYCCAYGNSRFSKDYSREISVRQDGQVFFSMVHVGGGMQSYPHVPLEPTETSYDYAPVVPGSEAGITYERVKIPVL